MASLSIPNSFSGGNTILSAQVNSNFQAIVTWSTTIDNTNLATFSGVVFWNITTNVLAESIVSSSTQGAISIALSGILASGKSGIDVNISGAQTTGSAAISAEVTNAGSTMPTIAATQSGTGDGLTITHNGSPASGKGVINAVSTTAPSYPCPRMTTAQRNALSNMSAGAEVYNTDLLRKEVYDGSHWVDAAGRTGYSFIYRGGTIAPDSLLEDGSAVSRTTYAALFAKIGTTYGAGDGSTTFNLPNSLGRVDIGDGTGTASDATPHTLGQTGGTETHLLTGNESGTSAHTHPYTDPGHEHNIYPNGPPGAGVTSPQTQSANGVTNGVVNAGMNTGSYTTGITINNSVTANAAAAHNNMQPYLVAKKVIII